MHALQTEEAAKAEEGVEPVVNTVDGFTISTSLFAACLARWLRNQSKAKAALTTGEP